MFRLRRPSDEECERLLTGTARADLSYPEVGATRSGQLPRGYHHDRCSLTIGPASLFDAKAESLLRWRAHLGAGVNVIPGDSITSSGSDHLVLIKLAAIWIVAPVRIVYLIEEPDRRGFAYGTLSGHPESGEEAFVVERHGDRTEFHITAFSKPANLLVRVGSPVSRAIQSATTRRYLQALK